MSRHLALLLLLVASLPGCCCESIFLDEDQDELIIGVNPEPQIGDENRAPPVSVETPESEISEADAILAIKAVGGFLRRQDRPGGTVIEVLLQGPKVTGKDLKYLKFIRGIYKVDLNGSSITDGDLAVLREIKGLEMVWVSGTRVTDAGLKELKGIKGLRGLDVISCRITDAGMKDLKEMKGLQELNLSGTQITDAGLKDLREVRGLRRLDITSTTTTDASVEYLMELQDMKWLSVGHFVTKAGGDRLRQALPSAQIFGGKLADPRVPESVAEYFLTAMGGLLESDNSLPGKPVVKIFVPGDRITDAHLGYIRAYKDLRVLILYETRVTDEGLKSLKELQGMETLELSRTDVTDTGLKELEGLRGLRTLLLHDTKTTPAGRSELRRALPGLTIIPTP
jgi:internalin A